MDSNQANRICATGTVLSATAGAIVGGWLSWAAPLYKTLLAEASGCALGLWVGLALWNVFAWLYNAAWDNGFKAGQAQAGQDANVSQTPADPPAPGPTDSMGGQGPTASSGTA